MADDDNSAEDLNRRREFEEGFREWLESPEGVAFSEDIAKRLAQGIVENADGVVRAAQAVQSFQRRLVEAILPHTEAITAFVRNVDALARKAARWVEEHQEEIRDFAVALEQWPERQRALFRTYGRVCTEAGWPPTLQLPMPTIMDLVKLSAPDTGTANVEEAIEHAWLSYFTDDLVTEIVDRWWVWSEVMEPRRLLLEQALQAHREGRYALSVPVFIAQVEGVLASTFAHSGQLRGHGVKRKKQVGEGFLEILASRAGDVIELNFIVDYSVDVLFGQFEHGAPVRGLNRHAILHGADTSYATRIRSLQAILALDLVVEALGFIATDDGLVHRPGCERLRGVRAEAVKRVYRSEGDASVHGLTPCPQCHQPCPPDLV